MNFLRKNLFYVGLIVVWLVAMIVELVFISSAGTDNEGSIAVRTTMLGKLKTLGSSGSPINAKVNELEKGRVEEYRNQANTVSQMSMDLNSKSLLQLMLRYKAEDPAPVFPVKTEDFYNKGTYGMVTYYLTRLEDLRKQSVFTTRPSPDELKVETERQEAAARAAGAAGVMGPGGMPPAGMPPSGMTMPSPMDPHQNLNPAATAVPTISPADRAVILVKMQKASQGRIYIDPDAIEKVVPNATASVSMAKAWEMQVSLWVQSDIIGAINQTNDQVMRANGQAKKDVVANAAVKRLESIKVNPAYVGVTAVPGATPVGGAGAGGSGMPINYEDRTGMPDDMGGSSAYGSGAYGSGAYGSSAGASPTLTTPVGAALGDRISNPNYDVIRYKFQVIMPARHLNTLLRNLMGRNYHTVVNIEATEVVDDPKDIYYYGTEPVMRVAIDGQLLLLTAWERGLAGTQPPDAKEKVWQYPPLMPVDVLNTLPKAALRPDDNDRISAAAAAAPR